MASAANRSDANRPIKVSHRPTVPLPPPAHATTNVATATTKAMRFIKLLQRAAARTAQRVLPAAHYDCLTTKPVNLTDQFTGFAAVT